MNERNDTGGFLSLSLRKYLRGVCEELLQLLFRKWLRFKPCVVRLTEFNRLEDIEYVFQIVATARTDEDVASSRARPNSPAPRRNSPKLLKMAEASGGRTHRRRGDPPPAGFEDRD